VGGRFEPACRQAGPIFSTAKEGATRWEDGSNLPACRQAGPIFSTTGGRRNLKQGHPCPSVAKRKAGVRGVEKREVEK